jgi:nitroreductase
MKRMTYERIINRRSIRFFTPTPVPKDILKKCVDAARLSPSGANRQPLKFIIIHDLSLVKQTFALTRWAGHLPDYSPTQAEMPMAYIAILLDTTIQQRPGHDAGIAAMSISLVADEAGLGTCMLGSVDREQLRPLLNIPENLDILMLVAIGYTKTKPVLDKVKEGDIKYWLDEAETLHVPKRALDDVLSWNTYQ